MTWITEYAFTSIFIYISALISFTASAMYTMAAMRFMIFCAFGDCCRRSPKYPEKRLIIPKTIRADMINTKPRVIICSMTGPLPGWTNWGKNERKNMDTFGFVIFMIIPRR